MALEHEVKIESFDDIQDAMYWIENYIDEEAYGYSVDEVLIEKIVEFPIRYRVSLYIRRFDEQLSLFDG